MLTRTLIAALFAFLYLACPARGQDTGAGCLSSEPKPSNAPANDFSRTVFPLADFKLRGPALEEDLGTGFCVDPDCRFIGTNYHVAATARHPKIRGARIVERYLATGPQDEGVTLNRFADGGRPLQYNLDRDLAVFELDKPLRQRHGLRFNSDDLRAGQSVDIYAYPKGTIAPFRSLAKFPGTFKAVTSTGLLAFDYVPNEGRLIRGGASGGIVVDRSTQQIVGILSGIDGDGAPIALAVSVEAFAEFLNARLPFLAGELFPIRAIAPADRPDLYSKYEPPQAAGTLERRSVEPSAIEKLRQEAQSLAEGMRDFIAVQTFEWGKGDHRPASTDAYEVQVRDGVQKFREYPDGKKWSASNPWPTAGMAAISPGDVWSTLPLFIGTHVGVKIREADGAEVDVQRLRVFQYAGSDEDNPCVVSDVFDLPFLPIEIRHTYTAYGEVWTDSSLSILRMSLHCEKHGQQEWEDVMTFGWFSRPGLERRLVPVKVVSWSRDRNKGRWCRSQFVDYHEFFSRARILQGHAPIDELSSAEAKAGERPQN